MYEFIHRALQVIVGVCVVMAIVIVALVSQLRANNTTPPTNTDPIYQVNLNGSSPQIVKRYEEGDDVRPNLHTIYYYPELDQYEVVVTMGRDR